MVIIHRKMGVLRGGEAESLYFEKSGFICLGVVIHIFNHSEVDNLYLSTYGCIIG